MMARYNLRKESSERSSELEAAIAEAVLDPFNIVEPEEEDLAAGEISVGVVVPFTD